MRGFLLGVCFLVFVTYVQGTGYCSRQDHYNPFGTVLCSFFGRLARENDKCSITCGYGHILEGTQKIVCRNWKWSGSLGDCKAITCPPLSPVQLASVSPRSCLTRPSRIDHFCIFTCPEGYHGKGHWGTEERRFCTVNGKWTGNDIICEDGQKPEITCPKDITVPTDPGQATAKIKLLKAAYSDNSQKVDPNAKLVLKSNVPLESDMKIGKHYGRYTVQDSAGLIASCNFGITVEDREPPKIMNCPNDITKVVDNNRARINWNEPKITDNSGEVTIYSDIFNGSEFPLGTRTVTYTVKDKSFNTNKCSFQVTVKQTCKDVNLPHPPFPKCSFLAADLSKCDETDWRYFPENLKWKDFCRKTCKVC